MSAWDLPVSVLIGDTEYFIRYQYTAVLDVLRAYNDPELDQDERLEIMLRILIPDFEKIPVSLYGEAIEKCLEFIDCNQKDDGKKKPKLVDWEQDAYLIMPEINKVAGREIRWDKDIHWWTFLGWYMGIGDGFFTTVIHIRKKLSSHKKLEKWEQEFYRENKNTVDLKKSESAEERSVKDSILSWL